MSGKKGRKSNRQRFLKHLKGVADGRHFTSVTDDGKPAELSLVVFPILLQDLQTKTQNLVGTGFLISQNIFVTAKHVFDDIMRPPAGKQFGANVVLLTGDGRFYNPPITRIFAHNGADIAVGLIHPMLDKKKNAVTNKMARLHGAWPEVGANVFTYAYPASTVVPGAITEIHLWPQYFEGVVEEHFPNGRDRVLLPGPCLQTSMHLHGGASGGPVWSGGKVIGINSTSFGDDPISYITPISLITEMTLSNVVTPSHPDGKPSIADLIAMGHISYVK